MLRFWGDSAMRQAQTLNDAQLRRVIQYCRSRRHPTRDETIILTRFYAGLRAKEIAALTVGNVFDEAGDVREQFILSAAQSKGGHIRTVYLNQRFDVAKAKAMHDAIDGPKKWVTTAAKEHVIVNHRLSKDLKTVYAETYTFLDRILH